MTDHQPAYTKPVATKIRIVEPSPKMPSADEASALRDSLMSRSRRIKLAQALDILLSQRPELLTTFEDFLVNVQAPPPGRAA